MQKDVSQLRAAAYRWILTVHLSLGEYWFSTFLSASILNIILWRYDFWKVRSLMQFFWNLFFNQRQPFLFLSTLLSKLWCNILGMSEMDILWIKNLCRCSANCLTRVLNSVTCMAVASVLGTKAGHVPSAMFLKENHESFKNRYQNAYGQHCTYKVGMILEKKRAKFSIFLVVSPLSCLQR